MNKKEKMYFVDQIFANHINYDGKKEFDKNWDIIQMFKVLELIPEDLFNILVQLIKDGAKEDKFSAIITCQEYLCKEFGIPIKY